MKSQTHTILYKESQSIMQWWLWLLFSAMEALIVFGFVQQVILGVPFGSKPAPDVFLIIILIAVNLIVLLIFSMRLETELRSDGIYCRFFPLYIKMRFIPWSDLKEAYVRQYNPIREYGGWGIRLGLFGKGRALNAKGNQGLQLVFKDNKRLLLGTQNPEDVRNVLLTLGWKEQ